jgi:hypothetical protein
MTFLRPAFAAFALATVASLAGGCIITSADDDGPTEPTPVGEAVDFVVTIENVTNVYKHLASGDQAVPVGETEAGPLSPGSAYEVELTAGPGQRLSLAAMFVHSNDLFFAPSEEGIALFDDEGNPTSGDVTDQIMLWDAGTELNQDLGAGPDQAPTQAAANTGEPDADNTVRLATDDFGNLPAVADLIAVTLTPGDNNTFTLRVENMSDDTTLALTAGGTTAVPIAPVVYALHTEPGPLFTAGEPDRGEGLEALAEDGDPGTLAETLATRTGLASPYAPGVYAISAESDVLFSADAADRGEGLEALAEDGDPSELFLSIAGNVAVTDLGKFDTPEGATDAGPALPGDSYSFTVTASPGEHLDFATMLVQSNDFFVAPSSASGIALFDAAGSPVGGDVTSQLALWNAGTEVDQAPGAGSDQAPRQAAPNTGEDEGGMVVQVSDEAWPGVDQLVVVTITVQP